MCSISIMTLIGCWRFTGTHTQNAVLTVGNNETTPLRPDSLLGEFTKASQSRLSETSNVDGGFTILKMMFTKGGILIVNPSGYGPGAVIDALYANIII